jgi:hypothetical protein
MRKVLVVAVLVAALPFVQGCAHLPIEVSAGGHTVIRAGAPGPLERIMSTAHAVALTNKTFHPCLVTVYDEGVGWVEPGETLYDEWGLIPGEWVAVPVVFRCFHRKFEPKDCVPFSNFVGAAGGVLRINRNFTEVVEFTMRAPGDGVVRNGAVRAGRLRKVSVPRKWNTGAVWAQFVNATPHPIRIITVSTVRKASEVEVPSMAVYAPNFRGSRFGDRPAMARFRIDGLAQAVTLEAPWWGKETRALDPIIIR